VATGPSYAARLSADQKVQISEVRRLRRAAADLRSRVSQGSYGDEELALFWKLVGSADLVLRASNPELGARAGLGDNFFSSVARDRRRPKLTNFLKALTAIIEVADERLFDIDNVHRASSVGASPDHTLSNVRIEEDLAELLLLASSLARVARTELEKLDSERPNDPVTVAENKKQRELLLLFADGFEQIAVALAALERSPSEPLLLGKASDVVNSVGGQINGWWRKHGSEAIDWGMRVPVFAAGVAMLGWAGADMTVATSAVAALVGGTKVINALRRKGAREK
jgi:hypothetical protein